MKIIRKNKWARIVRTGEKFKNGRNKYIVEASGPHGWITGSDYENRDKALSTYKMYSRRG